MNLSEFERFRKETHKTVRTLTSIGVTFFITSIILFPILGSTNNEEFIFMAILTLIGGIILLVLAAINFNKFKKRFKSEILSVYMKDNYDNLKYDHNRGLDRSTIYRSGLLRKPDRFNSEDLITGEYKGIHFNVSDCHLEDESTDSEGNTTYSTYFRGRYFIFNFNKNIKQILRAGEGRLSDTRGLEKVETESIMLTKKFKIYCDDANYVFKFFTPVIIEKLVELEAKYRGGIYLYLHGNEMHFALNDGKDYMEISLRKELNKESLIAIDNQINMIYELIDMFKLDSEKFN